MQLENLIELLFFLICIRSLKAKTSNIKQGQKLSLRTQVKIIIRSDNFTLKKTQFFFTKFKKVYFGYPTMTFEIKLNIMNKMSLYYVRTHTNIM